MLFLPAPDGSRSSKLGIRQTILWTCDRRMSARWVRLAARPQMTARRPFCASKTGSKLQPGESDYGGPVSEPIITDQGPIRLALKLFVGSWFAYKLFSIYSGSGISNAKWGAIRLLSFSHARPPPDADSLVVGPALQLVQSRHVAYKESGVSRLANANGVPPPRPASAWPRHLTIEPGRQRPPRHRRLRPTRDFRAERSVRPPDRSRRDRGADQAERAATDGPAGAARCA